MMRSGTCGTGTPAARHRVGLALLQAFLNEKPPDLDNDFWQSEGRTPQPEETKTYRNFVRRNSLNSSKRKKALQLEHSQE